MKALIAAAFLAIGVLIAAVVMSGHTAVTLTSPKAIGAATPVSVDVNNPHGVRRVNAFVEQNGAR